MSRRRSGQVAMPKERPGAAINNFDLIRLFAATEVAIKHGLLHLGLGAGLFDRLSILPGVPIFFLISGYLIFQSFSNSRSVAEFALNRVVRIYPALYVCFGVTVALLLVFGAVSVAQLLSPAFLAWVASQLTIAQFYNPAFLRDFGVGVINGSLWTISVELQFYCLTPVLAWIVRRFRAAWLPLILISLCFNLLLNSMSPETLGAKLLMVTFLPWFYMFMIGAWLSTRPDWVQRVVRLPWAVCLLLFGGALMASALIGLPWAGNEVGPVSFAAIAVIVLKCAYTRPTLSDQLLRRNDVSYGVYIYHMLAVNALVAIGWVGTPLALGAAILATYGLAIGSWLLVERPALAFKRRTLRRY